VSRDQRIQIAILHEMARATNDGVTVADGAKPLESTLSGYLLGLRAAAKIARDTT
jgi:hypothetical protein